ncbi:hypothetical protein [Pantoea rwandensis]|uniref:Uncharacterized protein n=1 Tax=Pantoea rwandensis TaxID=1076550 RepID=A0ABM5RG45_9GAMM|nr:hypothetical protein [Pantoea rwandensis]AIR84879.1 hypothetical protein LH22_05135 [Pantoea rwandensis]
MSYDFGIILSVLGLACAVPALLYALRVTIRILISFLWPQQNIEVNYTNKDGEKFRKKIKINKNDQIFRALDEIAKNEKVGKTHHG